MRWIRRGSAWLVRSTLAAIAIAAAGSTDLRAASGDRFPEVKPASRAQAISVLSGGMALPVPCLTPRLASLESNLAGAPAAWRRALGVLNGGGTLSGERRWIAPDGTVVRFTLDPGSFDRIAGDDANADGVPDIVQEVHRGVRDATAVLVDRLGLDPPAALEVLLADIDSLDGLTLPAAGRERTVLVLDSSPADLDAARDGASHQLAHAVAATTGAVPAEWGEALAQWTVMRLRRGPSAEQQEILSARVARLAEGLLTDDLVLAAGNALWLAFLEEAYGLPSVGVAVRNLASGDSPGAALERTVRSAAGQTLEGSLREFHLWAVLVGERSDGRHFSFADRLAAPEFSGTADGMPDLSVQADPPIAALGAAGVRIVPGETEGGITILFEGALAGRWGADLLLARADGTRQRVALPVTAEGRGELTVPLDGLSEIVLLVRNLSADPGRPLRYTWSVYHQRGFPFELGSLDATFLESSGVLVSWETVSESQLMGFNVVRTDEVSGDTVRVNPVWVPAIGDRSSPMAYQFLDATARTDQRYVYLIEGITFEGLTSRSEPFAPLLPSSP